MAPDDCGEQSHEEVINELINIYEVEEVTLFRAG